MSGGLSSILARKLGAKDAQGANQVFTIANFLSVLVAALLMAVYGLGGEPLIDNIVKGSDTLARMSQDYISVLVMFAPLKFILSLHIDGLRSEGKLAFMTLWVLKSNARHNNTRLGLYQVA